MRSLITAGRGDRKFLLLILLCVVIRGALWLIYSPGTHSDTTDYRNFATMILRMDFSGFFGARTPAYPMLLALCAKNDLAVWGAQSLLGIGIALMLYRIGSIATGRTSAGLALGMMYTLSLNLLFFEATILTETLTTFFLLLSMLLYLEVAGTDWKGSRGGWLPAVLAGIAASLLWLTRPLFLFVPPVMLLFIWVAMRRRGTTLRSALPTLLGFVIPAVALYMGWCSFVYSYTGSFKPSTLTGLTLTQHTGGYMELAPEKYATVRDIYLRHSRHQMEVRGSHSMTIWDAQFEMRDSTGMSFAQLSDYLLGMSLEMIAEHPLLYLRSVTSSWLRFWMPVNYYELSHVGSGFAAMLLQLLWRSQKIVMIGVNALFLFMSARALVRSWRTRRFYGFDNLAIAIVLITSVVQALLEYGHNDRFAAPVYPLIYYVVVAELLRTRLFLRLKERFAGAVAIPAASPRETESYAGESWTTDGELTTGD